MFEGCEDLQSVTLGNGIETLGRKQHYQTDYAYYMFGGCDSLNFESINLPTGLKNIEYGVMEYLLQNKTDKLKYQYK